MKNKKTLQNNKISNKRIKLGDDKVEHDTSQDIDSIVQKVKGFYEQESIIIQKHILAKRNKYLNDLDNKLEVTYSSLQSQEIEKMKKFINIIEKSNETIQQINNQEKNLDLLIQDLRNAEMENRIIDYTSSIERDLTIEVCFRVSLKLSLLILTTLLDILDSKCYESLQMIDIGYQILHNTLIKTSCSV